jgi:hypothetical protein
MVAERIDWQTLASQIKAPPRKVVVAMLPAEKKDILRARYAIRQQIDQQSEARAYAEFSMSRVRRFFDQPIVKMMSPQERKREALHLAADLAMEFRDIYHRALQERKRAAQISDMDLGVVVASPSRDIQPGQIVACHPEDGTWLEAFGHVLRVFGAFLPDTEWSPRYCNWWESVQCRIEGNMLRAYGDKIIIELDKMPDKVGELFLPDVAQTWNADCTIKHVGPRCPEVQPGERWSVDLNLVTNAGLQFTLGNEYERQFVIPPEALNFKYQEISA